MIGGHDQLESAVEEKDRSDEESYSEPFVIEVSDQAVEASDVSEVDCTSDSSISIGEMITIGPTNDSEFDNSCEDLTSLQLDSNKQKSSENDEFNEKEKLSKDNNMESSTEMTTFEIVTDDPNTNLAIDECKVNKIGDVIIEEPSLINTGIVFESHHGDMGNEFSETIYFTSSDKAGMILNNVEESNTNETLPDDISVERIINAELSEELIHTFDDTELNKDCYPTENILTEAEGIHVTIVPDTDFENISVMSEVNEQPGEGNVSGASYQPSSQSINVENICVLEDNSFDLTNSTTKALETGGIPNNTGKDLIILKMLAANSI